VVHPLVSLGHSIYRILFRGGSPQRIHYSNRGLLLAMASFVLLSIVAQRYAFGSGVIQIGVFLLTLLAGLYVGLALLTRKVPRERLRVTQLAIVWILAATQLLLVLCAPVLHLFDLHSRGVRSGLGIAVSGIALLGIYNCLRFALASKDRKAGLYCLGWAISLAAFYSILIRMLEIVFS